MIREINLAAINPVVAAVQARNIALAARSNTPLSELMSRSFPLAETQLNADSDATLLAATGLMTDEGEEGHSVARDVIVKRTGEAIVKHAAFARGVVLPVVNKIFSAVKNELEEDGPVAFDVEQIWLHDAVTSPLVSQLIDRYEGKQNISAPIISTFPERTEEFLTEALKTGSSSYDTVLADLLSRLDVVTIYNCYFRGNIDAFRNGNDTLPSVRFSPSAVKVNEYLIVHLLAKALMETPHEGSNQSLLEYRSALAGYVESTGCALSMTLAQWDNSHARKVLVIQYPDKRPTAQKVIYVFGPMYQLFLERGGDAEAVIGAYVSSDLKGSIGPKYLQEFLDNVLRFKTSYSQWLGRQDNQRLARSGETIKSVVVREIATCINELTDADNVCNVSKEQMHRVAAELTRSIPESEWIKSPYQAIRMVVCRSMFPTSNAFRILVLIDEETQKRGEEDVRMAAYHAVKVLLVEHFLSQVQRLS